MLTALDWLALEVKYLERASEFYATHLRLPTSRTTATERAFQVGDTELVLREPSTVPRGGVHTHFAFSTPAEEYQSWFERLASRFDLVEHEFGTYRSLYFDDPDGHCVEIGQSETTGDRLTGIFEIVFEVEDMERAEAFYTALGASVVDRGETRRRIRLDAGPVEIELWEPQLGLADARGGVHLDVGFETHDPDAAVEAVASVACSVERFDSGARVCDPDGHYLTFT